MKKLSLFITALMLGLTATAFAGNPKGEAKELKGVETTASTNSSSMYWYDVQYDASNNPFVSAGTTPTQGERENVEGECEPGDEKLCKVGYSTAQTLPINNLQGAEDQITRSE